MPSSRWYFEQTLRDISACHYCGRIERMTIDHKLPKVLRRDLAPEQVETVLACLACNREKRALTYEEFQRWLLSPAGLAYIEMRHVEGLRPRQRCQVPHGGAHQHFCAARRACGILRRRITVLDDAHAWEALLHAAGLGPPPAAPLVDAAARARVRFCAMLLDRNVIGASVREAVQHPTGLDGIDAVAKHIHEALTERMEAALAAGPDDVRALLTPSVVRAFTAPEMRAAITEALRRSVHTYGALAPERWADTAGRVRSACKRRLSRALRGAPGGALRT